MRGSLKKVEPPLDYPLAESSWGTEEHEAIGRVLASGRTTMGENVRNFETAFARKLGARFAVMVSSGSAANLVATAALCFRKEQPLRPGDEVIVPALSWATTYYPLAQYGLKLRFVDIQLDTLNLDVTQLELALTPRTRMVVGVSILGNPAALDVMRDFCDRHGLILFEDNCESMGASLNGKPCGTFGDVNTFSTFFSHHLSTMEGGIILTDDLELYHLCLSLRAHGWTRDLPEKSPIYEPKGEDFFEAYRFILPGYNARPLELSGAIGLEQLKKFDRMMAIRRENAARFRERFQGDERFFIQREHGQSSWFCFTVILNPELKPDRARVMSAMRAAGIQYRIITGGNFLRHDVIRYIPHERVGRIENADIAHDLGFFVGNFPRPLDREIQHLHAVLDKASR